jgi:hypothetical protein
MESLRRDEDAIEYDEADPILSDLLGQYAITGRGAAALIFV